MIGTRKRLCGRATRLHRPHVCGRLSSLLAHTMKQISERQESPRGQKGRKNTKRRCLSRKEVAQLVALSDHVAREIERTARIGPTLRYLVHLETVERVLREWQEIGGKFIPDPSERQRFNRLLSQRAAQMVWEEAEAASREKRGVVKKRREWHEMLGKSQHEIIEADVEKA